MRNIIFVVIALTLPGPVFARSPVQELKENLVSGCESRGLERGANPDAVYAFCSCTWDVLSHGLTVAEYVQMDALVASKGSPASLPFWARIQSKLQTCKDIEARAVKH